MLFRAIASRDFVTIIVSLLSSLFVVFCTLPLQEYAQALVATKLGDNTAKLRGRLTLNPMSHINLIGALMLIFVGFGWGNPVPIDERNFKNPRKGLVLTYLAGPLSSILIAFIMMIIMNIVTYASGGAVAGNTIVAATVLFFYYASMINISLAVLLLLPIPPFTGYRVLALFLPPHINYKIMQYEQIISWVVIILLVTDILSWPLYKLTELIYRLFYLLASLPFSF